MSGARFSRFIICVVRARVFGVEDAGAQLNGTTLNVSAYYPNSSSVYQDPGNRVVSGAVEYPAGSFSGYNPAWEMDITDNQWILTWTDELEGSFQTAAFNGFILDTLGTPITSASVDPASDFFPVSLTVNGNRIEANFQNEYVPPGPSSAIITVVPEPSGLALLALAAPALLRRRRQSRQRQPIGRACAEVLEGRRLLSLSPAVSYAVGPNPQAVATAGRTSRRPTAARTTSRSCSTTASGPAARLSSVRAARAAAATGPVPATGAPAACRPRAITSPSPASPSISLPAPPSPA